MDSNLQEDVEFGSVLHNVKNVQLVLLGEQTKTTCESIFSSKCLLVRFYGHILTPCLHIRHIKPSEPAFSSVFYIWAHTGRKKATLWPDLSSYSVSSGKTHTTVRWLDVYSCIWTFAVLAGSNTNSHDSSSQLEECRDALEDFHHGPVKA